MRQFIKDTLVELHKTCTTDKYGQVGRSTLTPSVFGERKDEVRQYCKDTNGTVLSFSTYGWQYGTYTAFSIQDEEIRQACSKVLCENENYLRNINSW